jgi:hypothetical protein
VLVPKVSTTIPEGMKALLDQCVARRMYGDEAATIRHFIGSGLERLIDQSRLVDIPSVAPAATETPDEASA